jgi:hypothetical protein
MGKEDYSDFFTKVFANSADKYLTLSTKEFLMKKLMMMLATMSLLALVGCATGQRDVASLHEYSNWPEKLHQPEDQR